MIRSAFTPPTLRAALAASLLAGTLVGIAPGPTVAAAAPVFINELHYDNDGADTGEFVEVAGPAGTDLAGWSIELVNGSNGAAYDTIVLSGSLTDQDDGFGALSFAQAGIQNGSPDGLALVDPIGTVVEFLSYEGVITAVGGVADGMSSTDIGVSEPGTTPVGFSLSRTGSGTLADDFAWQPPAAATPGAPNTGQDFVGGTSGPADPVINELGVSDAGADNEFVEIFGDADTDYSTYTVIEIEGDTATGVINSTVPVGVTDASGLWVGDPAPAFQNGSATFLLLEGFTGVAGDDLDTDDDGAIDVTPWTAIIDGVAISDGGPTDRTYATPVLDESFDDARLANDFAPGGLSRIPDGADTDTPADWYRNDFDWDGAVNGTPEPGEALNTPGAPNEIVPLPAPTVFISEIHYDNEGADVGEFVEVEGDAGADLTGWSLVPYNGSGGGSYSITALSGSIDDEGAGQGALSFAIAGLQNGSPDGIALVDDAGSVIEFLSYEGSFTATDGPADGLTSTDLGVAETGTTPIGQSLLLVDGVWTGPAAQSPGELNSGGGTGGPEPRLIHEIQGPGDASPLVGTQTIISGIVVGDFQEIVTGDPTDEPLDGFFVQEEDGEADADPSTSEGIFVFAPGGTSVSVGDLVEVTGTVSEFFGLTEIASVSEVTIVSSGNPLPTPAAPVVPTSLDDLPIDWEAIEGMSVAFDQPLYVSDLFPLGSYGEVGLSAIGPFDHPNQVAAVGSSAAADVRALNLISRVVLDDGEDENESFPGGLSTWNPTPTPYLDGPEGTLRAGDVVNDLAGVVHYSFGEFEVHPVNAADATDPDGGVDIVRTPRPPTPPDVGGDLKVASFNVLNYFVSIDEGGATCGPPGNAQGCRGADTPAEFDLQSAKISNAIAELDADVVGLIELENSENDEAIADLVAKVNAISNRTYDYVPTGYIGTDAISVGLIYDPATVALDGGFALLDSSVSPAFIDDKNRPTMAQTFTELASGENVTIAVNHLKSKGSACDDVDNPGDPVYSVDPYGLGGDADVDPLGDPMFTGNCNLTRLAAARVLGQWIATGPTGAPSDNLLILGDLNAYANEDPITELEAQGYADLNEATTGSNAWADGGHSYVFDGEFGTLDYALANAHLAGQVTGAAAWHINADEPFAIDYQNFNPPGQASPDEWKSSDHDPLIVGIDLDGGVVELETARELKEAARDELAAALPTGSWWTDFLIGRAIVRIEASLNPSYWVDDSTLDPARGWRVFANEAIAAKWLMLVRGPAQDTAQAALEHLVAADDLLASDAVGFAIAAGGDEREIARAERELARAAVEVERGRFDRAIRHFRSAWRFAVRAVGDPRFVP